MSSTHHLVENFFRRESANLIAVLTRAFGIRRIELIEDMVQMAMLEAMNAWKQRGAPDNPAAWIHRVATQRILDALRRDKAYEKAIAQTGQTLESQEAVVEHWLEDEHIADSLLRMIFVCCHPSLERRTQIALTLKTLCGFGVSEISQGLLLPVETVKKRIHRAKRSLAALNVSMDLPAGNELDERTDVVHDLLYLMFNEGYDASIGDCPIRQDICEEAVRLTHVLCQSQVGTPATRALLALLLFHSARLDSRVQSDGAVVLLEDQDRQQWDQELILIAQKWLVSSKSNAPTRFHLEAAIAMHHCISADAKGTDWETIVQLYDRLLSLNPSPIYILNQAIALAQMGKAEDALRRLQSLAMNPQLKNYHLLDCALAKVYELTGQRSKATDALLSALSKSETPHVRRLVEQRLSDLTKRD